jgi:hypothetical protein
MINKKGVAIATPFFIPNHLVRHELEHAPTQVFRYVMCLSIDVPNNILLFKISSLYGRFYFWHCMEVYKLKYRLEIIKK